MKGLEKVVYVAKSPYTVKWELMSAGRLYDRIGDKAKGKILFVEEEQNRDIIQLVQCRI